MASSTTTRLAFIAILVVAGAYFAPKAVDKAGTFLGDLAGANDAVVIGEGETALMVAADAEAKVVNCTTDTILAERRPADTHCSYVRQFPPDGNAFLC